MKISWLKWNPRIYNPFGDQWSRCAAGRLLAFGGGIIGSSILTHRYVKKQLEEQYDKQLDEVKDYYASLLADEYSPDFVSLLKKADELHIDGEVTFIETEPTDGSAYMKVTVQDNNGTEHEEVVPRPKLDAAQKYMLRTYGSDQFDEKESEPAVSGHHELHEKSLPKIRLISEEEFLNSDLDGKQEKQTVLFYPMDGQVVDAFDVLVDDHYRMLGTQFVRQFELDRDADRVFVRNIPLGSDYEVELVRDGHYARDVLGYQILPEPRQPTTRKDV